MRTMELTHTRTEPPQPVLTWHEIARRNGAAALDAALAKRRRTTPTIDVAEPTLSPPRGIRGHEVMPKTKSVLDSFDKLYRERRGTYRGMLRDIERATGVDHSTVLYAIRRYRTERCEPEDGSVAADVVALWDDGVREASKIVKTLTERGVKITSSRVCAALSMFRSREWHDRKAPNGQLLSANIVGVSDATA